MPVQMKRPQTTVELCTDLSLAAEHAAMEADLREAESAAATDPRLAKKTAAPAIAKKILDLEKRMEASTLVFTLAALPRKRWVELAADHPPREDNDIDESLDVNLSTFADAAMPESIVGVAEKVSGKPVEFTAAEWGPLADEMTNAQWEQFAMTMFRINRQQVAPNFSRAASLVAQNSASK